MDSNDLIHILLISVAVFLFYQVFIAEKERGKDRVSRRAEEKPKKPLTPKPAAAEPRATEKPAQSESTAPTKPPVANGRGPARPQRPDDLTRIEGIGPKIAKILSEAGITTHAQLAASDIATLEESVTAAGIQFRRSVVETWPEQARLVGTEQWEPLNALQATLKGRTKRDR